MSLPTIFCRNIILIFWPHFLQTPLQWNFVFRLSVPFAGSHHIYILCIKTHDTGCSFGPIFMKFTWLVRVHPWVNPTAFGNNWPNKTTDMENVPPKTSFLGLSQTVRCFWGKKWKLYSVPHFPKKRLYSLLSSNVPFPQKWSCPHPQKSQCLQERLYWFLSPDAPSPQNGHVLPQISFSSKILLFLKNLFHNKIFVT